MELTAMNKKYLLAIGILSLIGILLFTAYNSNMHIIRPRGVTAAFGGGGSMAFGRHTFESSVEIATDVVIAEFVAQRPFGQFVTEFEFIVHDRVFGNAADTIFVYTDDIEGSVIRGELQFTTSTQYLLVLIKLADVYASFHDDSFMFITDLMLDLNDPSRSTMYSEPLSYHSRMNFNSSRLTKARVISYVRALPRDPFWSRVFIVSDNLGTIISGSPYVLVIEINEPRRLATEGWHSDIRSTDLYYTTVVEVLKGDLQAGDLLRMVFFAGTVFPGETHIVSVAPVSQSPYFQEFTSRYSLHSMDQLGEIIAIIAGTPYPIPNRDDLHAAITQAETHTQQNYTPQSWANLQYELEAAIAVYEDPQTTQEEIGDATESLLAAIYALEPIPESTPSPSPTPTSTPTSSPTPTPTPRPPGTTHTPGDDSSTTAATPTPGPAATPMPSTPATTPTPATGPTHTTTTNPETGETITLNRPTANLPHDFTTNILNRDPVNEVFLDETFQLTPNDTPARIGIYVGDQNLSDEQLVTLAGFILNPQTGQYEIVRGFLCQDSNTFYVDFTSAGIAGIILYERPTPLLRFTIGQVRYYHNGQPLTSDVAPFLSEGRTMIPIRIISEALGATPVWDDATHTAYIHKGEVVLRLPMGQPLPGGLGIPELINSRVLVPARFVIENFNAITLWNAELQEVTVYVW